VVVLKKNGVPFYYLTIKMSSPFRGWGIMSKFGNYIQAAYDELIHKVTWPTWEELQQTTIIVLIALGIVTAVIFGMDLVSENVLTFIYKILGK
jgi:preprotein translocase subunit SecE